MKLIFPAPALDDLKRALLESREESCAILIGEVQRDRVISSSTYTASRHAYRHRDSVSCTLSPDFLVPIVAEARGRKAAVIFVHTHPDCAVTPRFSAIDDAGEKELAEFLGRRVPELPHMAVVIGPGGVAARQLGTDIPVRVLQIGAAITEATNVSNEGGDLTFWDRQVRAFGVDGQSVLKRLKVGIVGAGGTGSVVAKQLTHLGVGELLIIDPDTVEVTNLNRLIGASLSDVGMSKADVIASEIARTDLGTKVTSSTADVRSPSSVEQISTCDAIFSCTDSHSSRAVLNQIAFQYLIPTFDVGVAIGVESGRISHVAGRAQMLAPGLGCLVCGNVLNAETIRRELMSTEALAADPYFDGVGVAQPAVVSINSTMASLLVSMFLSAFTGAPLSARLQYYDGISGKVRSAVQRPDPTCVVCSRSGALAKGASWPIITGMLN